MNKTGGGHQEEETLAIIEIIELIHIIVGIKTDDKEIHSGQGSLQIFHIEVKVEHQPEGVVTTIQAMSINNCNKMDIINTEETQEGVADIMITIKETDLEIDILIIIVEPEIKKKIIVRLDLYLKTGIYWATIHQEEGK